MQIDWSIVQATLALTCITFFLGVPLKWVSQKVPYYCLPAIGLIVFGGVVTPILYFFGNFQLVILLRVTMLLSGFGVVLLFPVFKKSFPFRKPTVYAFIGVLLFVIFAFGLFVQASKYSVPGGIDPAVHVAYISHIKLVGDFQITYPLGMHLLTILVEEISSLFTPAILLGLQIFFLLNISLLVYYIIKRISGYTLAGIFGTLAVIIDASLFNNHLNGSLSHLFGVFLVTFGVAFTITVKEKSKVFNFFAQLIFYISILYFHFISLFILLPVLWLLRIFYARRPHWSLIFVFPLSVLIAVPVLVRMSGVPGFTFQIIVACLACVVVETVIHFLTEKLKVLLSNIWTLSFISIIALLTFHYLYIRTGVMQPWYGPFILLFSVLGIIFVLLKRMRGWYPFILYSSGLAIFDYVLTLLPTNVDIGVFRQMIFYYGYTTSFILLGAVFLFSLLQLIPRRAMKVSFIAVMLIASVYVASSRFFDKVFVTPTWAVSRYGKSDGFGLFYTLDDVRVANWARQNLPKDVGIANPGGLYNAWATVSERKTLYLAFSVMNSADPKNTHQEVVNLLTNNTLSCPQYLQKENFQYLFIPAQYELWPYNPCLSLVHQSGKARLYKISSGPVVSNTIQTVNLSDPSKSNTISITGDYSVVCPYCNSRLYYQFQEIGRALRVPSKGTVVITIASPKQDRRINLLVQGTNLSGDAVIIGENSENIQFHGSYLLRDYLQRSGRTLQIQIEDANANSASIQLVALETLR
ncbi:MAG: hypothetical protein WCV85_03610 [Patescibacteria group bacterium]